MTVDDEKLNRLHWRMIITAGTGFFTDAYDLFVIGVATALLAPVWHLNTIQVALLNGAALISAAFGAIIFGWFSDKFGRKQMYGFEILVLFIGAIVSALSPSYTWLLISRLIVGFGIGGDYPSSAAVVSEAAAHRKNRGFIVLLVFAMQALGMIIGPLVASFLLVLNIPHEIAWRILIGLGAIPAASVFYLRRTLTETPRHLLEQEIPFEVSRVISDLTGHENHEQAKPKIKLTSKKWLTYLIGTASAWFLLDVAFYGNSISSVWIINSVIPNASLLKHTLISALIFLCFAVPGYVFAARYVDKIGRKPLQIGGFAIMGICYLIIAAIVGQPSILPVFVCIFGISFFFVNFGPNTTTFLIPSEIYPTAVALRAAFFS